jgi:hypothetical protein
MPITLDGIITIDGMLAIFDNIEEEKRAVKYLKTLKTRDELIVALKAACPLLTGTPPGRALEYRIHLQYV